MNRKFLKDLFIVLLLATCFSGALQLGTISARAGATQMPRTAASPSTTPKNYTWGTSYDDTSYAAVASQNAIFVTGYSAGGPLGGGDIFLAKFDLTGELILLRWWGGQGPESAAGIGSDEAGNIYIIGVKD